MCRSDDGRTEPTETATEVLLQQASSDVQYHRSDYKNRGLTGTLTAGYRRWLEFDPSDHPGQDFCAYRFLGDHVVGVLVDGVSQSFHGQIAARRVGEFLLDELWENRDRELGAEVLEHGLRRLASRTQTQLAEVALPDPPLLRRALQATRADSGSQAVFAAFVFSACERRLALYQVGDVVSWVFCPATEARKVEVDPKGRWSSTGRLSPVQHRSFEPIQGVLLHSDGMDGSMIAALECAAVGPGFFHEHAEAQAADDDVSFVALSLEAGDGGAIARCRSRSDGCPADAQGQRPKLGQGRSRTFFAVLVGFIVGIFTGLVAEVWIPSEAPASEGSLVVGSESRTRQAFWDVHGADLPSSFAQSTSQPARGQIVARVTCLGRVSHCDLKVLADDSPAESVVTIDLGEGRVHFVWVAGRPDLDSAQRRLTFRVEGEHGRLGWTGTATLSGLEDHGDSSASSGYYEIRLFPSGRDGR